jgi:hypothetical protein
MGVSAFKALVTGAVVFLGTAALNEELPHRPVTYNRAP